MTDDQPFDLRHPFRDLVPDTVAEVAVAALGLSTGGPAGLLAAATPFAARIARLVQHEHRARQDRSGALWGIAGHYADRDLDELASIAEGDLDKLHLGYTAGEAAATARYPERLIVLGRALAGGLLAEDRVAIDRQQALVDVLAVLERPHLRILADIEATPDISATTKLRTIKHNELVDRYNATYGPMLEPVVALLEREGLLATTNVIYPGGTHPEYGASAMGSEVLSYLRAAAQMLPPKARTEQTTGAP